MSKVPIRVVLETSRVMRWSFFLLLFGTFPFPLFGLEGLTVPAARFLQLAASLSVLVMLEDAGGMVGPLLALLWLHAVVYALILYASVIIVERWISPRLPAQGGRWLLTGMTLALVYWSSTGELYHTTFHHSDAHASLLELYR